METIFPDYKNCIANLACSILKEFHVEGVENETLQMADELFKHSYKNIVVILLDAMGQNILEKNLDRNGFFYRHLIGTYHSVFPSTTVAATTSINSGLFPSQHSWLGWDCYYKEIDKNVTVFLNTETGTVKPAADYNVAWTYCPYRSVRERILEAGYQAYEVTPFVEPYPDSFDAACERIRMLCGKDGKKYIYSYWPEPDSTMHRMGCYSDSSKMMVRYLEGKVKELCEQLTDTLVLITADHGHINSNNVCIQEYPKIMECLVRMPSIEARAVNFFVKEGYRQQFEKEFSDEFGDKFLLLTKEKVKEKKLFGPGKEHERFDEMLGDYLAVAVGDVSIFQSDRKKDFIGVHAGLTKDEMLIPLIAVEKK